MASIIRDSFDFYSQANNADFANYWDTVITNVRSNSTTTRFSVGQSMNINGSGGSIAAPAIILKKAAGSNQATQFTGFARTYNTGLSGTSVEDCITWFDGTTAQCTLCFVSDGSLVFKRGSTAGTVLATFVGAWAANNWDQWQFKVIISSTVGEIHVRKNGNTSDDFSATGLNNQSSANAYANAVGVQTGTNNVGSAIFYDDFWAWDGDTGSLPHDWLGDFRAYQIMPNADTAQKQFTALLSTSQIGISTQVSTNTRAVSASVIATSAVQTVVGGGTITSINLNLNAGFTGNAKVAIYDSDGVAGVPGTLLAVSSQVTNPGAGVNNFTLATPASLTLQNGHEYYLAMLTDTNCTMKAGASATWHTLANAYASGFPSSLAGASSGATFQILEYGTITCTNNGMLNEVIEDGSTTYVSDGTVGDYDLYGSPGLPVTPASILGVSIRSFVEKSDAGSRSGALVIKSGSTTTVGSSVALATTFQNLVMIQDTDPNTGLAWTASGVNNAQFGPKVAA